MVAHLRQCAARPAALVDWCREWWTETGISADEMPTDENELITSYFEEVESEYYELEACQIQ